MENSDYQIESLGEGLIDSPLGLPISTGAGVAGYVAEATRIFVNIEQHDAQQAPPMTLEKAGARAKIYFRPGYTKAAIVTCGGLSPGLNNVIRSLYMQLYHRYGIKNVVRRASHLAGGKAARAEDRDCRRVENHRQRRQFCL